MGGGDLNSKKAWHPNTLKNQERVWKAEQAAAEEKKRIVELERERLLERERAELNKFAKSNLAQSNLPGDDRLHWMYEKPDKKVQQEEYLLGKAIDKNHEQAGKSEVDDIPAVSRRVVGSSMLTASGDAQVDLARKLREDPLLLVKERERAARAALLNNPIQRARLTELLRMEQKTKKENKSKKKKKKSKDLDNLLAEKLHALSDSKGGIDLASLLASDDSSSESSDEKFKTKKKKSKKKSKSKHVKSSDNDEECRHKTEYNSKKESKKVHSLDKQKRNTDKDESISTKRKKKKSYLKDESDKSLVKKHGRNSSDDSELSSNDFYKKNVSKYGSHKSKSASIVGNKRKKRDHSVENELTKSHVKRRRTDSTESHQSSVEKQSKGDKLGNASRIHVREDRYWKEKQYISNHQKFNSDQYSRDECQSKEGKYGKSEQQSRKEKYSRDTHHKYEHEDRQRHVGSHRNSKNLYGDVKNDKDKDASVSDKGWRSKKSCGLSEEEKATKLAAMVAAGAEREKQRERRVADQLAEKESDDRPSTQSRSRNVIRQLPDSLESRLHSNRHYIQRDQKHMNENFARR